MRGPDGSGRDGFIFRPLAEGKIAAESGSVTVCVHANMRLQIGALFVAGEMIHTCLDVRV